MKGLRELERKLEQLLLKEAPERAAQAVREVSLAIAGRAMGGEQLDGLKGAPVETGHLRESGYVLFQDVKIAQGTKEGQLKLLGNGPAPAGEILTAKIGFNATTPDGKYSYALIQHERTDFQHPRGGEAKYLEKALRVYIPRYHRTLEREMRNAL